MDIENNRQGDKKVYLEELPVIAYPRLNYWIKRQNEIYNEPARPAYLGRDPLYGCAHAARDLQPYVRQEQQSPTSKRGYEAFFTEIGYYSAIVCRQNN